MPRNLPANIILAKNQTSQTAPWLILLDITLINPSDSSDTSGIHIVNNTENIMYQGREYAAFPFEIEPSQSTSKGEIPTVELRISNVLRALQADLDAYSGGIRSTVKLTVVHTDNLGEDYSELEMDFAVLACSVNAQWVTFTLGASNPLRQRFPLYRYLAHHCCWRFKSSECGYSDSAYTSCDRSLASCRERGRTTSFGGFPGLADKGIRIA